MIKPQPFHALPLLPRDRIATTITGTYGTIAVNSGKGGPIRIIPREGEEAIEFSLSEARSLSLALRAAIAFADGK